MLLVVRQLVREHGENAWIEACKTQLAMKKKKDAKGVTFWRQIVHEVVAQAERKGLESEIPEKR